MIKRQRRKLVLVGMAEVEESIQAKLSELENEIKELKSLVSGLVGKPRRVVAIGGFLKGLVVNEEEFKQAERALFETGV